MWTAARIFSQPKGNVKTKINRNNFNPALHGR